MTLPDYFRCRLESLKVAQLNEGQVRAQRLVIHPGASDTSHYFSRLRPLAFINGQSPKLC